MHCYVVLSKHVICNCQFHFFSIQPCIEQPYIKVHMLNTVSLHYELDDVKKISTLKNVMGIEGQKSTQAC